MDYRNIFITATGTDVGKTYISALLVKYFRQKGINCGYYKPALSGAISQSDGNLLAGDCEFVIKNSNIDIEPKKCVSYCFEEAVSPHLAASRIGVEIKMEKIEHDFKKLCSEFDMLVVEGAGGIACPFFLGENKILLSDVIKSLNLDTVLVADAGLGTINSVVLTFEYAKARGINIIGVIYNNYEANNFMHDDNIVQIEALTGLKPLAKVKYGDSGIDINEDLL